ncbi:hypothetical protein [Mycobacterium sp. OTB74]|jgi:hypothetical protein|uniref:hypothetical protein n=1 Tax=Mycobacterium sp. OTB74 TaxID=1853452 RepID=UPI0024761D7E|nr:hypothetical protein [Mycobacterium sp. OTB74]MDH6244234.1 hypothetical protein [Mycobacterium sp. OTB74]
MKRLATVLSVGAALLVGSYVPSALADPPTPGQFCSQDLEGKSNTAKDGTKLTCVTGQDGKDRWSAAGAPGAAAAGQFCSKDLEGKTGTASDGTKLTCTAGTDGKDRWTKK